MNNGIHAKNPIATNGQGWAQINLLNKKPFGINIFMVKFKHHIYI